MNNFLDHIYNRWYIKDYDYEDTYPLAFMGIIYALLPQVLLTQRLLNLRTDNVHSLHIWEYLASKGLGEYESILSNKQSRFLYKNINYNCQVLLPAVIIILYYIAFVTRSIRRL